MIILGIIQGIAEWLPVSSEGLIVLVQTNFFTNQGLSAGIKTAIFLHLGTVLAALVYFRKDILNILSSLLNFKHAEHEHKKLILFLFWTTLISGGIGALLLDRFEAYEEQILFSTQTITLLIGILLLVTGGLLLKSKGYGKKNVDDLNTADIVILGIAQGLAALPGFSRSGLTVAALLLRNVQDNVALRLSFLMSIPLVIGANIVLQIQDFSFSVEGIVGLLFAFVFGLITIDLLLKLAKKLQFGYFVVLFGLVTIVAAIL